MPLTVLHALHILTHLMFVTNFKMLPSLSLFSMTDLRLSLIVHNHTANKRQNQETIFTELHERCITVPYSVSRVLLG